MHFTQSSFVHHSYLDVVSLCSVWPAVVELQNDEGESVHLQHLLVLVRGPNL